MADTDIVRAIIQDVPLYQKEQLDTDGIQTSIQVFYFPVVGASVIITGDDVPSVGSIDESNGLVTFVSAPTSQTLTIEYRHVMLLDAAIQTFITLEADPDGTTDLRLAAADALDAIARSQALIQKKIKLLDLETDGPALAKELRASAAVLRDQVFKQEMNESTFDIIETVELGDNAAFREKVIKDWMRQNA